MKPSFRLTGSPARLLTGFALFAALWLPAHAAAPEPFELHDADRVLFIGDTFFEREVDYGHIETRLTAAFSERNITFRNLAWAADTPIGRSRASFDWNKPEEEWLKRVKEQVALVKPTVAFLSYGMTASLEQSSAGVPPAQQTADLEKFKADMNKLMDAIEEVSGSSPDGPKKVRFVLLGPVHPVPHALRTPEVQQIVKNASDYERVLLQLAGEKGISFVSVVNATSSRGNDWTDDSIHLNNQGYRAAADVIVKTLAGKIVKTRRPDADFPRSKSEKNAYETLRYAIRKKNELFFHRWRPENWTYLFGFRKQEQGQNAVEIPKFDPLIAEWEARIARLRDLKHQDPATVKEVSELTTLNVQRSTFNVQRSPVRPQPIPTFEIADGFEVNLWAEDPQLHKPIEINWDAQGRLWVASSEVYPQIRPGQPATDSIIVLEDTNGDGKADKSTVFAGDLLIPTGVLPDSNGGCYVAASHQLLHFKDTNGDGKADEKRIVLSSFGTEDTHHNLHTLRWGYDGHIYMNQSIYTHTHIETPHGIVRLNSGGIWRFDPYTDQLEVFTRGGCNPWGHASDYYGNSFFTDGAGFQGVSYCVPGAMYFTYAGARRELQSISPGNYPKFASLEVVRSPQFPDDWQGDFITCDFRAHRVVHFKYSEAGAGFQTKEMPDLLRSTNVTFRPIDVKFGPDGALYIADWSNPIIQHGEVDFRDPRRDKEHGRIWRVVAKSENRHPKSELAKKQDLTKLSTKELLDRTLSKNAWEREHARNVLARRAATSPKDLKSVQAASKRWSTAHADQQAKLEVLWLAEATRSGNEATTLLRILLSSSRPEYRTAAVRVLSNWGSESDNTLELLQPMINDDHPRVRLEALRALAKIPSAKSAELALSVLDKPMDPFLEYALWLTLNDLADPWIAAIKSGKWKVEGREKQLEFGLKAIEPEKASQVLGVLLGDKPLPSDGRGPWIELIGRAGSPRELQRLFDQVLRRGFNKPTATRALAALNEAARLRSVRPLSGLENIGMIFQAPDPLRKEAIRLAGAWKSAGARMPELVSIAEAQATPSGTMQVVFETLREIGGPDAINALLLLCSADKPLEMRQKAALALAALDLNKAAPLAVAVLVATPNENDALELWRALLNFKG
ncbi:MAG: hypothetical protein DME22_15155, partial [Verrucomicrobia bacterium]